MEREQQVQQLSAAERDTNQERKGREVPCKTEHKYITISGFLGNILNLSLVDNPKTQSVDLFVKFTLGQDVQSGQVKWTQVALRGKAAERFCDHIAHAASQPGRKYLALRGTYQQRRQGTTHRLSPSFWAFGVTWQQ